MTGIVKNWTKHLLFSKRYVFSLLFSAAVVFIMTAAERRFPTAAFSNSRIIALGMLLFLSLYGFSAAEWFFRLRGREVFFVLRTFPVPVFELFAAMLASVLPGWLPVCCACIFLAPAGSPGAFCEPLLFFASCMIPGIMAVCLAVFFAFAVKKESTLYAVYTVLTTAFFFLNGFWLDPISLSAGAIGYFPTMLAFGAISGALNADTLSLGTEHAVLFLYAVAIGITSYAVFRRASRKLLP